MANDYAEKIFTFKNILKVLQDIKDGKTPDASYSDNECILHSMLLHPDNYID